ncbi:hypothetical protein BNJ_00074 [Kaumoebavirus]|uniref:hypothetical protein n=1 Tax=Kaumoebavirus TaxID=1859492 RepID=UPI0009C2C20C|nr:hypothetical protein BNJ_00074 [Kaumoebavirus]ARA71915.1 hypothetical protein BNJ_00074 [Kaumoebavirus]
MSNKTVTNFATNEEVLTYLQNRFTKIDEAIESLAKLVSGLSAGGKRKVAAKKTAGKSTKKGGKGSKTTEGTTKRMNAMVWFKSQYVANSGGEFLTNYINTKTLKSNFAKMKEEADYIKKTADKRLNHEAGWIWNNLTKDQKDEVKAKHKKWTAEQEAKVEKKEEEEEEAESDAEEEKESEADEDEAEEEEDDE